MLERDLGAGIKRGACYWCPNPPDSVEELLPQWLNKGVLEYPPGVHVGAITLHKHRQGRATKTIPLPMIGTKRTGVKGICAECNNGWMSRAETAAKPLLVPMINGYQTVLRPNDQLTVAHWACMKAAAYDADPRHEVAGLASSMTRTAIKDGRLPIDMVVTLSAYEVALSFLLTVPGGVGVGENQQPVAHWLMTMVLGHLVIQIFGRTGTIRPSVLEQAPGGISSDNNFSIWPPQPGNAMWPPRCTLREGELESHCAGAFPGFGSQIAGVFDGQGPPYRPCGSCGRPHGPPKRELPVDDLTAKT